MSELPHTTVTDEHIATALAAVDQVKRLKGKPTDKLGGVLAASFAIADERDRLAAENARLRDALEQIAREAGVSYSKSNKRMYEGWRAIAVERIDLARAALSRATGDQS